eukprot:PhF_6_TR1522/c0_g1_i3/m.2778
MYTHLIVIMFVIVTPATWAQLVPTSCTKETHCSNRGTPVTAIEPCDCTCPSPFLTPDCAFASSDSYLAQVYINLPFAAFSPTDTVQAIVAGLGVTRGAVVSKSATEIDGDHVSVILSLRGLNGGGDDLFRALVAAQGQSWALNARIVGVQSYGSEVAAARQRDMFITVKEGSVEYGIPLATFGWLIAVVVLVFVLVVCEAICLRKSRSQYEVEQNKVSSF